MGFGGAGSNQAIKAKMAMSRLLLARHGESESSVKMRVGGHRGCGGLTPKGVLQVADLSQRILKVGLKPTVVMRSHLRRSSQTAEILGLALSLPVLGPECAFCERHAGSIDSVPFEDLAKETNWLPQRPISSGGESSLDLDARVKNVAVPFLASYRDVQTILVSHLGFIESFIRQAVVGKKAFDLGSGSFMIAEATAIELTWHDRRCLEIIGMI